MNHWCKSTPVSYFFVSCRQKASSSWAAYKWMKKKKVQFVWFSKLSKQAYKMQSSLKVNLISLEEKKGQLGVWEFLPSDWKALLFPLGFEGKRPSGYTWILLHGAAPPKPHAPHHILSRDDLYVTCCFFPPLSDPSHGKPLK